MHISLAVRILVDRLDDLFPSCIEFIPDIEDIKLCNTVECSAYGDRGRCSAGTDQYQLHSLKIDALFLDALPVAHAIGVVALELSGDIAVLIAEIYDRIDRAAELCCLIDLIKVLMYDRLVRHGDVRSEHLQCTDTLNRLL